MQKNQRTELHVLFESMMLAHKEREDKFRQALVDLRKGIQFSMALLAAFSAATTAQKTAPKKPDIMPVECPDGIYRFIEG